MQHQCPHCPKNFAKKRNLDRHILRMHPDLTVEVKAKETGKGAKFEVKKPPVKSKEAGVGKGYHHIDCGSPLEKGQTPCPGCGKPVDWSKFV